MKPVLLETCPPTDSLSTRPLFDNDEALALEKTFKILANSTRIRLLHALSRENEMCVSDLADLLGLNTTAISNQLQRLTERGILGSRREGVKIYYRILDPCAVSVVNHALCLALCAQKRKNESE